MKSGRSVNNDMLNARYLSSLDSDISKKSEKYKLILFEARFGIHLKLIDTTFSLSLSSVS